MDGELFIALLLAAFVLFNGCNAKRKNDVTNNELLRISEELYNKVTSNLSEKVHINLQGQFSRKQFVDISSKPFLNVEPEVLDDAIIQRLRTLLDNYVLDTRKPEIVTDQEHQEQEDLVDVLLQTDVVNHLLDFLFDKGYINGSNRTRRDAITNTWFSQFPRQRKTGIMSSSGFEHIFVGELKNGRRLSGLHDWNMIDVTEKAGNFEYYGYMKQKSFGKAGSIVEVIYKLFGKTKMSSTFVGTPLELELSLITLCHFARRNRYCRLSMNGVKFGIRTYDFDGLQEHPLMAALLLI